MDRSIDMIDAWLYNYYISNEIASSSHARGKTIIKFSVTAEILNQLLNQHLQITQTLKMSNVQLLKQKTI